MQTFLPYRDFYQSAKVLDQKRLGKQRVEVLQLLNSIKCIAWKERGYKDTCFDKIAAHYVSKNDHDYPEWLGRNDIHQSHRSMLIQKQPDFYKNVWPYEKDDLEYVWPYNN